MNLYRVYNGFMGANWVHVLVVCNSESEATQLASDKFKSANPKDPKYSDPQRMEVTVLTEDIKTPWVSEVSD